MHTTHTHATGTDPVFEKLDAIFQYMTKLRKVQTDEETVTAIITELVASGFTLAQADLADTYLRKMELTAAKQQRGLEIGDFTPSPKQLEKIGLMDKDLHICKKEHIHFLVQDAYRRGREEAGEEKYAKGKRDGLKEAAFADRATINAELTRVFEEKLQTAKMTYQLCLNEFDSLMVNFKDVEREIEVLKKVVALYEDRIYELHSHLHKAVTGIEAPETIEILDETIAKARKEWAKHLLQCKNNASAPRPVNEETGRFDELEAPLTNADTPIAAPKMPQNAQKSHSDEFFDAPQELSKPVSAKKLTRKEQARVDSTGRAITTDKDEKFAAKLQELVLQNAGFVQPF